MEEDYAKQSLKTQVGNKDPINVARLYLKMTYAQKTARSQYNVLCIGDT